MNSSISAENNLFSAVSTSLSRHLSVPSIVVSAVLALAGVLSLYLGMRFHVSSDMVSMTLFTLGSIFLLVSIYRFFWKSRTLVYTETGSPVSEGTFYCDNADLLTLQQLLEKKEFENVHKVHFRQNGNVRMDYLVSKDGQFAAVQLFQFVPYAYMPASAIYYFKSETAVQFVRHLKIK